MSKTNDKIIKEEILTLINSDDYEIGDKFIAEMELCKLFDSNRSTIRRILDSLREEGYIERTQGSGTVILKKDRKYPLSLSAGGNANSEYREQFSTKFLSIEEVKAYNGLAKILEVEEGTTILRIKKVRAIDDVPLIFTEDNMVIDRLEIEGNLFVQIADSISKMLGWQFGRLSSTRIFTVDADESVAEMLKTEVGKSLIYIEEVARNKDAKVLDYSRDYYIANKFELVMDQGLRTFMDYPNVDWG